MKKRAKLILSAIVILIAAVAAAVVLLRPVAVVAEPVYYGELTMQFTESGTLLSRDQFTIEAKSSGIVSDVYVLAGRPASAGEALLAIDDATYRRTLQEQLDILLLQQEQLGAAGGAISSERQISKEQLRQQLAVLEQGYQSLFGKNGSAQASLEEAYSRFSLQLTQYETAKELFALGAVSKQALSETEAAYQGAESAYYAAQYADSEANRAYYLTQIDAVRAQIDGIDQGETYAKRGNLKAGEQLQVQIDALRTKLDTSAVTAPCEGLVGQILVQRGDYVTEHQPVAVLYGADTLYLAVSVLDEDAYTVREGTKLACYLSDGTQFYALVSFLSPVVEEQRSTVGLLEYRRLVELTPEGVPSQSGIGSKVEVEFRSVVVKEALTVASVSVVPFETGSAVYVVKNKKLELRAVELGARASGRIEVTSGLEEGELVVTSPYQDGIKAGARVSVE